LYGQCLADIPRASERKPKAIVESEFNAREARPLLGILEVLEITAHHEMKDQDTASAQLYDQVFAASRCSGNLAAGKRSPE
jgi:hypothetical protein